MLRSLLRSLNRKSKTMRLKFHLVKCLSNAASAVTSQEEISSKTKEIAACAINAKKIETMASKEEMYMDMQSFTAQNVTKTKDLIH